MEENVELEKLDMKQSVQVTLEKQNDHVILDYSGHKVTVRNENITQTANALQEAVNLFTEAVRLLREQQHEHV